MAQLDALLLPDAPDPNRTTASLIAEQERLRLRALIHHRLKVYGS